MFLYFCKIAGFSPPKDSNPSHFSKFYFFAEKWRSTDRGKLMRQTASFVGKLSRVSVTFLHSLPGVRAALAIEFLSQIKRGHFAEETGAAAPGAA